MTADTFDYSTAVCAYRDPETDNCSVFVDHVAVIEALANMDGVTITGYPETLKAIADAIYTVLEED